MASREILARMGDEAPSREGEVLADKYLLQRLLGSGGMGQVYLAENQHIQRTVAIKVLLPELASDPQVVERFLQEAKAANIVRHPNVVDVLDIGQDSNGIPFIVQEYLEGHDLDAILVDLRGRLPLESALDLLFPVVEAIGFAHQRGVVHRDLKPSNIFLARMGTKVVPKVLDFGIAKVNKTPSERRVTATGITMGTPAYIAPEVIRKGARDADARSDVWSIGVMLYEVLSGTLPFDSDTLNGLFASICLDEPAPLANVAPHLPAEIVRIVMACLVKDPAERYANAALVTRDLGTFMDAERARGRMKESDDSDRLVRAALKIPSNAPPLSLEAPAQATLSLGSGAAIDNRSPSSQPRPSQMPALPDLVLDQPPARSVAPPSQAAAPIKPPARIEVDRASMRPMQSKPPVAQVRRSIPVRTSIPVAAPQPPARREQAHDLSSRPLLALIGVLAASGAAALLGANSILSFARTSPQHATTALSVAGVVAAVLGVFLMRRLKEPGASPIGSLLAGGGLLGYAAVFGVAALQSAGAGLPNLAGVIAPVSFVCLGVGILVVAAGRAWTVWKHDRNWLLSILFVLTALAGGALGGHSVAAMLKMY
jgi:serine/threonine-protein kinase